MASPTISSNRIFVQTNAMSKLAHEICCLNSDINTLKTQLQGLDKQDDACKYQYTACVAHIAAMELNLKLKTLDLVKLQMPEEHKQASNYYFPIPSKK